MRSRFHDVRNKNLLGFVLLAPHACGALGFDEKDAAGNLKKPG